jgi:hypothetical protein
MTIKVRGYLKPDDSFRTLNEWEEVAHYFLDLQRRGLDTRGARAGCKSRFCSAEDKEAFLGMLEEYFKYQLHDDVDRWELLTMKNVLDFIEDFVNHRVWSFRTEYGGYFSDISKLRFAFFYSRGDMEPYVLLDEEFTMQIYGSLDNIKTVCHYTTESSAQRLADSIKNGPEYDVSTFTVIERPFFRPESNVLLTLTANIRAGFRSDVKSMAVDSGRRACNMYRLEYPGEKTNLCYDLTDCDVSLKTSLWNEYIATPIQILKAETR